MYLKTQFLQLHNSVNVIIIHYDIDRNRDSNLHKIDDIIIVKICNNIIIDDYFAFKGLRVDFVRVAN